MPAIDADTALALLAAAPDVQAAITDLRDALGAGHVTWHLMVNAGAPLDVPLVHTTYPPDWVSRYLLNGFARLDPVVRHGLTATEPFFWADLPVGAAPERVLTEAAAHGIPVMGLSAPHEDAAGRRSLLSVSAPGDATAVRAMLGPLAPTLAVLAPRIHRRGLDEAEDGATRPRLAPRELECLRWVAQGKSHTEIALILNLSPHTVRGYLRSVRQQLDCVSLAQAVTQASRLRLL
jgi:DNA-binding CsgD family transcriptional regulator